MTGRWIADETWTAWYRQRPPVDQSIEVMRGDWPKPDIWSSPLRLPETMNIAGLYWRLNTTPLTPYGKALDALQRIADLDPEKDAKDGLNEWGEAECFRLAQAISREAIGLMPSEPTPRGDNVKKGVELFKLIERLADVDVILGTYGYRQHDRYRLTIKDAIAALTPTVTPDSKPENADRRE